MFVEESNRIKETFERTGWQLLPCQIHRDTRTHSLLHRRFALVVAVAVGVVGVVGVVVGDVVVLLKQRSVCRSVSRLSHMKCFRRTLLIAPDAGRFVLQEKR